jgi:hypothetical protein
MKRKPSPSLLAQVRAARREVLEGAERERFLREQLTRLRYSFAEAAKECREMAKDFEKLADAHQRRDEDDT